MFGAYLVFLNNKGEELKKMEMLKLPVTESFLKTMSKERYGTDDPCILYETAIRKLVGLRIAGQAKDLGINEKLLPLEEAFEVFDYLKKGALDIHEETAFIQVI